MVEVVDASDVRLAGKTHTGTDAFA